MVGGGLVTDVAGWASPLWMPRVCIKIYDIDFLCESKDLPVLPTDAIPTVSLLERAVLLSSGVPC